MKPELEQEKVKVHLQPKTESVLQKQKPELMPEPEAPQVEPAKRTPAGKVVQL